MPFASTTIVPRLVLAVRRVASADAVDERDDVVSAADDELAELDELSELPPHPARTSAAADDSARIQDLRTGAPFVAWAGPDRPPRRRARRAVLDGSSTQRGRRAATESIR